MFSKTTLTLIFFQGHAAPVLYAAWAEAGLFPAEDLMNLRKIDNDLEGHPTPVRSQNIPCRLMKINATFIVP